MMMWVKLIVVSMVMSLVGMKVGEMGDGANRKLVVLGD